MRESNEDLHPYIALESLDSHTFLSLGTRCSILLRWYGFPATASLPHQVANDSATRLNFNSNSKYWPLKHQFSHNWLACDSKLPIIFLHVQALARSEYENRRTRSTRKSCETSHYRCWLGACRWYMGHVDTTTMYAWAPPSSPLGYVKP
jgi:hypothetical protein